MRKTKIVATLGPASSSYEQILRLIKAGVAVFRLNFSHGDHSSHLQAVQNIRRAREELKVAVAILADLQGPKIRTGKLADPPVELLKGQTFTLTIDRDVTGDSRRVSTNYPEIVNDVNPGDAILVDDGKLRLQVLSVTENEVTTNVVNGGLLYDRKAINLPGTVISTPALTEKDKRDLRFAISDLSVDYVALSFVRKPHDVQLLKTALEDLGSTANVIIKIEKPQAVNSFEEILSSLSLGDGIMIARGDLGVEVEIEKVPALQKRMIKRANQAGIITITATQMLESLMHDVVPSRAEASDIFNATLDGSDAVMLSGETAVGSYPVEAVDYMVKIINEAEEYAGDSSRGMLEPKFCDSTFGLATVRAAHAAAKTAGARALVALTHSGRTAVLMSNLSLPAKIPFYAMTPRHITYNKLALYYGVYPILLPSEEEEGAALWDLVDKGLGENSALKKGDTVVIASGYKISQDHTNVCKVVRLGHREYY